MSDQEQEQDQELEQDSAPVAAPPATSPKSKEAQEAIAKDVLKEGDTNMHYQSSSA